MEALDSRSRGRIGTFVRDKYRIDRLLATGSMASVYAATHRNGARVAIKLLHPHLARDPSMVERFRREGYFANSIGHPGVVRAIDDDVTEEGCAFLVMELLDGETLEQRRAREGGRLELSRVVVIADDVLEVLETAHGKGILHRDIKPENVFLTHDGHVKVLDFGVARWNDGQSTSEVTGLGMVLGTPAFMPPEQALGRREQVDVRSDLWSLGATLFLALAGEAVHPGGDAKARLLATARLPARAIRDVAPELPREVAEVIDRALAYRPSDRFPSAAAMRDALRAAALSLTEDADAPVTTARPRTSPHGGAPADDADVPLTTVSPRTSRRAARLLEDEPTLARSLAEERGVLTGDPSEVGSPASELVATAREPRVSRDAAEAPRTLSVASPQLLGDCASPSSATDPDPSISSSRPPVTPTSQRTKHPPFGSTEIQFDVTKPLRPAALLGRSIPAESPAAAPSVAPPASPLGAPPVAVAEVRRSNTSPSRPTDPPATVLSRRRARGRRLAIAGFLGCAVLVGLVGSLLLPALGLRAGGRAHGAPATPIRDAGGAVRGAASALQTP